MVRYLVKVREGMQEDVSKSLRMIGFRVVKRFNTYMSVEAPEDVADKILAIQGVVSVEKERTYGISAFIELPVEKQLVKFLKMGGPLNPLAMWYVVKEGMGKDRWPTRDSRTVLQADLAEKMGITGKGITVAVVDTGFDVGCPQKLTIDFQASTIEGDPIWIDNNGHGTHCLTTIAGNPLQTVFGQLEGVAKGVSIGAVKVLGYLIGSGSTLDVMEGIATAIYNGAKVISMSLGSTIGPDERHDPTTCPLCSFIESLADKGYIFCIAAGNDGKGYTSCPGLSRGAITVAALDKNLKRANFSSCEHPDYIRYSKPDIGAPGVNIGASTTGLIGAMNWYEGPKIAFISGTSMATPHLSGLMALWAEYAQKKGYNLTRSMVMDIFRSYSTWNSETGYGVPKFSWIVDYLK
jgi:subtilisin family serine protease